MFLSDEYTIRPPISVWLSPLPSLLARNNVVQNTVTRKKASGDFKDDVCSRGMVSKKDKSMFKINVYSIMDTALAGIQQNQSATGWLTGLLRLCYSITCSPLVGLVGWLVGFVICSPAAAAASLQSCPTLCDPIDGSPPGSPVPGILQARTLYWNITDI